MPTVRKAILAGLLVCLFVSFSPRAAAEEPPKLTPVEEAQKAGEEGKTKGDNAWMLMSTGLVMLMVPGLALFYAGMVRRKNVLATMMQSMIALSIVGVYWVAVGYSLAFGHSHGGIFGWSSKLLFLSGVKPDDVLPNTNIYVYTHMLFQGMFAIITPALISGAFAERIRFGPYVLFLLVWVTFIYCPLAHMVWAMNWWDLDPSGKVAADAGKNLVGLLGRPTDAGGFGALDFAGGTVVHIAAGFSALGGILVLRKRVGYPEHAIHPNSMVLCLVGAGLLWFGWFGFNGGSAGASGSLAVSAFAATQAAAAAGGLSWVLVEWLHRGKPTALGLASGLVAGLVAVTPGSGFVVVSGGLIIGLIAGAVCYLSVCCKPRFRYDDSLDVFGVHGVGGFLGALLTGFFCLKYVNPDSGADGLFAGNAAQVFSQLKAAVVSAVLAFAGGFVITKLIDVTLGFTTTPEAEIEGLDQTEHGEAGFDFGLAAETVSAAPEPRPAKMPPGSKRFSVIVDGVTNGELLSAWSEMCQPGKAPDAGAFKGVYPFMTTVTGNRFHFRGGDPETVKTNLQKLFAGTLKKNVSLSVQ
ncbi:MAG: ammonium transporter [Gemmataceae bacterium]